MLIDIDRRLSFMPASHVSVLLQCWHVRRQDSSTSWSRTDLESLELSLSPVPSAVELGLGSSYEISKVSDPSSSLTHLT